MNRTCWTPGWFFACPQPNFFGTLSYSSVEQLQVNQCFKLFGLFGLEHAFSTLWQPTLVVHDLKQPMFLLSSTGSVFPPARAPWSGSPKIVDVHNARSLIWGLLMNQAPQEHTDGWPQVFVQAAIRCWPHKRGMDPKLAAWFAVAYVARWSTANLRFSPPKPRPWALPCSMEWGSIPWCFGNPKCRHSKRSSNKS
jgi:hypothetical protein